MYSIHLRILLSYSTTQLKQLHVCLLQVCTHKFSSDLDAYTNMA